MNNNERSELITNISLEYATDILDILYRDIHKYIDEKLENYKNIVPEFSTAEEKTIYLSTISLII
ncbi:MAG: hypothetical protein RLY43_1317, partial [Bacteroidota bacterium]